MIQFTQYLNHGFKLRLKESEGWNGMVLQISDTEKEEWDLDIRMSLGEFRNFASCVKALQSYLEG